MDAGANGAPYTLREAAQDIGSLIAICRRCRHQRVLLPLELARRLGADFPVDQLYLRLRCTECRLRGGVRVEVAWRD